MNHFWLIAYGDEVGDHSQQMLLLASAVKAIDAAAVCIDSNRRSCWFSFTSDRDIEELGPNLSSSQSGSLRVYVVEAGRIASFPRVRESQVGLSNLSFHRKLGRL